MTESLVVDLDCMFDSPVPEPSPALSKRLRKNALAAFERSTTEDKLALIQAMSQGQRPFLGLADDEDDTVDRLRSVPAFRKWAAGDDDLNVAAGILLTIAFYDAIDQHKN